VAPWLSFIATDDRRSIHFQNQSRISLSQAHQPFFLHLNNKVLDKDYCEDPDVFVCIENTETPLSLPSDALELLKDVLLPF